MSKVQFHAYALAVLLTLTVLGTKAVKPLELESQSGTDFDRIPLQLAGWSGREGKFGEATQRGLPSCSLLLRYYDHEDYYTPVELAAVYGTDLGDFHQPEICLEGQGLRSISKGKVRVRNSNGTSFEAISLIMDGDYNRRGFVFWFSSEGVTSTFLGSYKVKAFLDRLLSRRVRPSALVRLSTEVLGSEKEAVDQLLRFAEDFVPYLNEEFAAGNSGG